MKLVLARIERQVNDSIPFNGGDVPETKMTKLLLHRIPKHVTSEELKQVMPGEFEIELKGWTLYEILRYAPQHNWSSYEEAVRTNPILAKMVITGVVYSVGDWIGQCFEGKPLSEFDCARMFRSGLVGFTLHGSLSPYYYQFCEELFPFQDWSVVPAKVTCDQTAVAAVWNGIYYIVLEFLQF